jgi:peptidoglycan/xylan/chitin deacetylase (PgdA/CDA1 family)
VRAESPEDREQPVTGYVALTFDDGPSGDLTETLLDGLRDRGARATFFLCGYRMDQYPDALPRYLAEGHEVGVHSTVHQDLTKLSTQAVRQDLLDTVEKIQAVLGITPTLMRPPGGAYNDTVLAETQAQGLSVILWSVDPRDWADHDATSVLHTMARQAGNGDIILMHDMSQSSITAALRLVDTLQAKGFCFVTVSELSALSGTELSPGQVYDSLGSP